MTEELEAPLDDEPAYANDAITDDDTPGVVEPTEPDEDDPAIDHVPAAEEQP